MKSENLKTIVLVGLMLSSAGAIAQKLQRNDVEMPFSKNVEKKGMYVNTTLTKEWTINTFVTYDLKKGQAGFDVGTIDLAGKLVGIASEIASPETAKKYNIEIPEPGTVENPSKGLKVLRMVSATGIMGKLKFDEGSFEPKYASGVEYGAYVTTTYFVLRGYKFKSEKSS